MARIRQPKTMKQNCHETAARYLWLAATDDAQRQRHIEVMEWCISRSCSRTSFLVVQNLAVHEFYSLPQIVLDSYYCIARNFRGLKFSWMGRFWIFADNIFTVASAPRPRPLFATNTWDPGIKIFAVNIFADCDRSAKSAKILTRENF